MSRRLFIRLSYFWHGSASFSVGDFFRPSKQYVFFAKSEWYRKLFLKPFLGNLFPSQAMAMALAMAVAMVHGPWYMVHCPCTMDHGTWSMDHGPWSMEHGASSQSHRCHIPVFQYHRSTKARANKGQAGRVSHLRNDRPAKNNTLSNFSPPKTRNRSAQICAILSVWNFIRIFCRLLFVGLQHTLSKFD